jgi:hypothetical protein
MVLNLIKWFSPSIETFKWFLSLLLLMCCIIKRNHLANWIKKEALTNCCFQDPSYCRNKHWLRVKWWKKTYQANGPWKPAGVVILISDKVDFKHSLVKGDKEGHFMLIKGAIHQNEITVSNLYALNCQWTLFHQTYTKRLKSTCGL